MPTLTRPGVYVDQSNFPSFTPVAIGASAAAFVGIHPRGPLTPTVINSWQDFVANYGGFEVAYPPSALALSVYSYFSGGGTSAVVIRAVNVNAPPTGPTTSTLSFNDANSPATATLQISADSPGAWGNNLYIDILPGTVVVAGVPQTFTMVVKYMGVSPANIVERWENLTMVPGSVLQGHNNYAIDVINATATGSSYITATDLHAAVGTTNLIGAQSSSFEDGLTVGTWAPTANCTLANVTSLVGAPDGTSAMGMTATASGIMTAATPGGINGTPVLAGKSYTANASFRGATVTSTAVSVTLAWYDINGNQISTNAGTTLADTTTSWTIATVTASAPAAALFASVILTVNATAASNQHMVDLVQLNGQNPNNNPVRTPSSQMLVGGTDGSPPDFPSTNAAIQLLDQFPDRAFILNLPGASNATDVGNAITYAQSRGDTFVVLDCPPGMTPQAMTQYGQGLAATPFAAVYYPQLLISDPYSPVAGRTRLIPPGGYVAGLYVYTDRTRGIQKAPAGLQASLQGVVGLERGLTNNDMGNLNLANVNCIVSQPNSGIVVWGARTLSSYASNKYVNTQRSLIFIQTSLVNMTKFAVFETNDYVLWNLLTSTVTQFLTSFWLSGGLLGNNAGSAFYVTCDQSNNTPQSIQAGIVNIEVGVALQRPAEYIVIQIGQWAGGNAITVR